MLCPRLHYPQKRMTSPNAGPSRNRMGQPSINKNLRVHGKIIASKNTPPEKQSRHPQKSSRSHPAATGALKNTHLSTLSSLTLSSFSLPYRTPCLLLLLLLLSLLRLLALPLSSSSASSSDSASSDSSPSSSSDSASPPRLLALPLSPPPPPPTPCPILLSPPPLLWSQSAHCENCWKTVGSQSAPCENCWKTV